MANTVISPNMNLPVPVVGVDPGPQYAQDVNSALTLIDGHTHAPGSGVQVNPSGLNINTDLPFSNNNATFLRSVRFQPQPGSISGATDLGCLYENVVDLYYIDGNGNNIRITQSGGIVGTPGSISGLTSPASATYVSANETFVFQSDVNTPANIDAASYILRNLTANSFGLTLAPPTAMSSNTTITLPTLPSAVAFLSMDTSGNISANPALNGGITATNMAPNTITAGQIANGTITATQIAPSTITGSQIAPGSIDASSSLADGSITNAKIQPGTIDASTRIASGSIIGANIASLTIAHSQLVPRTNGSGSGNVNLSASSGSFTAGAGTAAVTNLSLNLLTNGGAVMAVIQPVQGNQAQIFNTAGTAVSINLVRAGFGTIASWLGQLPANEYWFPSFTYLDSGVVGAGSTYNYSVTVTTTSGTTHVTSCVLVIYEL